MVDRDDDKVFRHEIFLMQEKIIFIIEVKRKRYCHIVIVRSYESFKTCPKPSAKLVKDNTPNRIVLHSNSISNNKNNNNLQILIVHSLVKRGMKKK